MSAVGAPPSLLQKVTLYQGLSVHHHPELNPKSVISKQLKKTL